MRTLMFRLMHRLGFINVRRKWPIESFWVVAIMQISEYSINQIHLTCGCS